MSVLDVLTPIWSLAGLPPDSCSRLSLSGADPVFPSSFAVGTAAQVSMALAALAAAELSQARGAAPQDVAVGMEHAGVESTGWFSLDGKAVELWDAFSGLYATADGYVRVHANFAHHRDGALRLLGLRPGRASRSDAEQALRDWPALAFEQAAADRGLVATALRSFAQWDATEQGQALLAQPLMRFVRIGEAPPRRWDRLDDAQLPLAGVRVLDLTRILAGPVGGRALAAYGADVLLVNSPRLPNIAAIADTSRGKRSAQLDLRTDAGREGLWRLVERAHVFSQGYRPGGMDALGFSPAALAQRRPGIVCLSLSAYGSEGPWAARRGFDSLVQTAMGFNHAEGQAAGDGKPRALPMQILDQATGYLMAFGASAALLRQQREGGSWLVEVSLAQTASWLRSLGRVPHGLSCPAPDFAAYLDTYPSGYGKLLAVRPAVRLSRTPARYAWPSMPPGTHPAAWW